jgi:signal recognition particle subunit SEC65
MAKSKAVEEVVVEEVVAVVEEVVIESTVVLNLPKEEPNYPGSGSRDFGKKEVTPEVTPEDTTEEEPIV